MSEEATRETGLDVECARSTGLPAERRWTRLLNLTIVVTLVALTAAVLVASGRRSLLSGDETRYGTIIREMADRGAFTVLTLNGEPYSHKPPLHFWTIYVLTRFFGIQSTWPYVLPSLIAFLALLVLVRIFMRSFCPNGWGVAVFIYATFYVTWGAGQIARMDAGFAMFTTVAILFVRRYLDDARPRDILLAGSATGLAILTKGPMAFVMVAALLLFERWRRRAPLPPGPYGWAATLAVAIPLLWLVPAGMHGGPSYLHELLITQNFGRAVGSFAHREPPWFYLIHAPVILFPWFFLFAFALVRLLRKGGFREPTGFFVSWILAVFVPFSLVSGKLEIYMLPLFVPVALLIASFLVREESRGWRAAVVASNAVVLAVLCAILVAALVIHSDALQETPRELLRIDLVRDVVALSACVAGIAVIVVMLLGRRGAVVGTVVTAFAALFPLSVAASVLTPILNPIATTETLVAVLARHGVPPAEITAVDTPYLWTNDATKAAYERIRYAEEAQVTAETGTTLILTRSQELRDPDAFAALLRTRYRLIDTIDLRGRPYYLFRRK